jgi:hypothetical protein
MSVSIGTLRELTNHRREGFDLEIKLSSEGWLFGGGGVESAVREGERFVNWYCEQQEEETWGTRGSGYWK